MNNEIIRNRWMHIGTDFKLNDIYTPKGRIRSGAKGIGRFALDRLGDNGEMLTLPKNTDLGYKWNVNWADFEKENAIIGKVTADLFEIKKMNFKETTLSDIDNYRIIDVIKEIEAEQYNQFKNGTILKITNLRDDWNEKNVRRIFNSLEILTPPDGQNEFVIHLFSSSHPKEFGMCYLITCIHVNRLNPQNGRQQWYF